MELIDIRKLVIIAMFSDDVLFERVVLKGGNALNIVHKLGQRSSLDIDLSIPDDFEDLNDTKARIFNSLDDRFRSVGYVVFDELFEPRPSGVVGKWGGYAAEFKLIEVEQYESVQGDLIMIRKLAQISGPMQQKIFRVQISKYEFCEPKETKDVEGYTIQVYTPEMIVIEKLRALCQQMDEYTKRLYKTPRGRDFYDIYSALEGSRIDLTLPENKELLRNIFAAKEVPPGLLSHLPKCREFHRQDWPSVVDSVARDLRGFDFYFDFVILEVEKLKSLWEV